MGAFFTTMLQTLDLEKSAPTPLGDSPSPQTLAQGQNADAQVKRVKSEAHRVEEPASSAPSAEVVTEVALFIRGTARHIRSVDNYRQLRGDADKIDQAATILERIMGV